MGVMEEAEAARTLKAALAALRRGAAGECMQQARVLREAGRLAEAVQVYEAVLGAAPGQPQVLLALGYCLRRLGRWEDAVARLREAAKGAPGEPEVWTQLGNALREAGCLAEALEAYGRALALNPKALPALENRCALLVTLGRFAEAAEAAQAAREVAPKATGLLNSLGAALAGLGRYAEALAVVDEALAVRAEAAPLVNRGVILRRLGRLEESRVALEGALALQPGLPDALLNLGATLHEQARLPEALKVAEAAVRADPRSPGAWSNFLYFLNFDPGAEPEMVSQYHREWGRVFEAKARPGAGARVADGRLTIGLVSGDFRSHSVAYFVEPLLRAAERGAARLVLVSNVAKADAVTARLRGLADGWVDVAGRTDGEAAGLVRQAGIDVLVDLSGHTAGNRLGLFLERPARVQLTWCGYPNGVGGGVFDGRVVDALTDPPGRADTVALEPLVRLPCFLCYMPPGEAPEPGPLPLRAGRGPVFGSFNALPKVNARVLRVWGCVLERVPGARLMLKAGPLGDPATRAHFMRLAAEAGIPAERLDLRGHTSGLAAHLSAYAEVDVALDTFPYNGTTTTCEALWMGVPVVALEGACHAARVGVSVLEAVGIGGACLAATEGAYVEKAVGLAGDAAALGQLRAGLRERMRGSRLCDGAGFAAAFVKACREVSLRGVVPAF